MTTTCAVEGCGLDAVCRGWCNPHYQSVVRYGDPLRAERRRPPATRCGVDTCTKPPRSRGLCEMHYGRVRRNGQLERLRRPIAHLHSEGYLVLNGQRGHPLVRPHSNGVYAHRDVLLRKIGPGEHPCHWCERPLSWQKTYPRDADALTADHLDGNKANNEPENLVPSCGLCNLRRARQRRETSRLAVSQIVAMTGLTAGAVYNWIRAGLLTPVERVEQNAFLFEPEDVRRLLHQRSQGRAFKDSSGRVRLRRVARTQEAG